MALDTRIESIIIRNNGGGTWSYTFRPNNFDVSFRDINWNSSYDEALDASLRQNFRGFRLQVDLNWEKTHSETVSGATFGDFFGDLVTSLADNKDDGVEISFNGGTNYDLFVPDGLNRGTSYMNQIGRANANLTFQSQEKFTSIPAYLEAPAV